MIRTSKRCTATLSDRTKVVHFQYEDPIYHAVIYVFIGGTIEGVCEYARKTGATHHPNVADGMACAGKCFKLHDPKNGNILARVIWMNDWQGSRENFLTLHHEVLHLSFAVMRDRGLILTFESEEAYTYYIEAVFSAIVQDIENLFSKLKVKKNERHRTIPKDMGARNGRSRKAK